MELRNNKTFIALTALWAFVESGLGGLMHALHLPFTGVFLGGFSVLVISLMAHFEARPYTQIIKATLIVMAVKFSVNPMTSPFAYIAVGFQGLLGALIYSLPFRNLGFTLLFSMLAMLESAFQKLLIITLIFGQSWLKALDTYYKSVLKIFGTDTDSPFSLYLLGTYIMIYGIWGLFLGFWAVQIPAQLQRRMHLYRDLESTEAIAAKKPGNKSKRKRLFLVIALILMLLSFYLDSGEAGVKSVMLVLRTMLVVLIWMALIMPLWNRFISKQLAARQEEETPLVLALIPGLNAVSGALYKEIGKTHSGLRRWKEFVLGLMVISLRQDKQA